jgi:predicted DNA-binding protein with PD1-like motif
MVDVVARARVTDVIYAQLSQDEDLHDAIIEIAKRERIETGLVLNIVGGLKKARLSMPVKPTEVEAQPGIREWEGGVMECSGVGIIGSTLETFDGSATSGVVHQAGEPYLHVHLTVTVGGQTFMGHLIEGCMVRSLSKQSHFTIALAKVEGARLNSKLSKERTAKYPNGFPVHELLQL